MPTQLPTTQLVIFDGVSVWQVSGFGVTVRHAPRFQAELLWHTKAVAKGYTGPAPVVSP